MILIGGPALWKEWQRTEAGGGEGLCRPPTSPWAKSMRLASGCRWNGVCLQLSSDRHAIAFQGTSLLKCDESRGMCHDQCPSTMNVLLTFFRAGDTVMS